jgi:5-methylthioribose kinase
MIDMPMDYTINTLYEFDKIIKFLNKEKILIGDSHAGNVIITDDNLVIIDPDYYEFNDKASRRNRELINFYITDLWAIEYGLYNYFDKKALNDILYKGYMQDYLKENIKRLDEKTPRDLIEKTLRKRNK